MTGRQTPNFAIPAHVYFREVDGPMVLLNLENEEYYGLDAVGTDIVKRLTDRSKAAALDALLVDYEVDPAVLRRDVDDLILKLVNAGLLAPREVSP